MPGTTGGSEEWGIVVAGKAPMSDARWSDLAVAAAAADKPSSGSTDPILTGPQAARRSAHKVASSFLLVQLFATHK